LRLPSAFPSIFDNILRLQNFSRTLSPLPQIHHEIFFCKKIKDFGIFSVKDRKGPLSSQNILSQCTIFVVSGGSGEERRCG
jgi:hypothetical protein